VKEDLARRGKLVDEALEILVDDQVGIEGELIANGTAELGCLEVDVYVGRKLKTLQMAAIGTSRWDLQNMSE